MISLIIIIKLIVVRHATINTDDINNIDTIKFTYKYREESDILLDQIVSENMKLIETNENNIFLFKRYSDSSYPSTIVIGNYNKENDNINDFNRSENVEIGISYLLSELVIKKIQISLLPIINIDVKISQIKRCNK